MSAYLLLRLQHVRDVVPEVRLFQFLLHRSVVSFAATN